MKLIIAVLASMIASAGLAEMRYNALSGRWEEAPSYYQPRYNWQTKDWKYSNPADDGTYQPKYNWNSNKLENVPARHELKYNYMENSWQYAPKNSELKFNYMNNEYNFYEK